jgi:hypothetical protein
MDPVDQQWSISHFCGVVVELRFPLFGSRQRLAVQSDGYVGLREIGDLRVFDRTTPELRAQPVAVCELVVCAPGVYGGLKKFGEIEMQAPPSFAERIQSRLFAVSSPLLR